MAKKFMTSNTRVAHTYKFLKDRRDDPKWRDDFLAAQKIHRRDLIIGWTIIVIFFVIFLTGYFAFVGSNSDADSTIDSSSQSSLQQSSKSESEGSNGLAKRSKSNKKHNSHASNSNRDSSEADDQSEVSRSRQDSKSIVSSSSSVSQATQSGYDDDENRGISGLDVSSLKSSAKAKPSTTKKDLNGLQHAKGEYKASDDANSNGQYPVQSPSELQSDVSALQSSVAGQ